MLCKMEDEGAAYSDALKGTYWHCNVRLDIYQLYISHNKLHIHYKIVLNYSMMCYETSWYEETQYNLTNHIVFQYVVFSYLRRCDIT